MSEFGDRVKALIEEKELSQKELSNMCRISEPSLCRYIRGDIEPRIDIVRNIAKALGVSETYLLGLSDSYVPEDTKAEIKRIVARNRNILTKQDKSDIIAILYGADDGK